MNAQMPGMHSDKIADLSSNLLIDNASIVNAQAADEMSNLCVKRRRLHSCLHVCLILQVRDKGLRARCYGLEVRG